MQIIQKFMQPLFSCLLHSCQVVMIQAIVALFSTQVLLRVSYPFKLSGEIRLSEVNLIIGTHRSSSLVQQREISPLSE